jgi:phosphatidylglycerophosphatase A
LPVMPGSWASLAALPCAWVIRSLWGISGLAVAIAIVLVAGCWAASIVANASGVEDPDAIVIDEVAGQWLVLLSTPLDPLSYSLAFLLFRIFDVWKPWPVRWADRRVHGGFGIILDDVLAAGYAFCVLLIVTGALGVRN